MLHSHSYLDSAVRILNEYKGEEPFASFLKKFFNQNKKHGSRDRKQIAHLCYCYFRLGRGALHLSKEERVLLGLFLCSNEPGELLAQLKVEWNDTVNLPLESKLSANNYSLLIEEVFPWKEELSQGIDHRAFSQSFFNQPDLFLRLRPGHERSVKNKLTGSGIHFYEINPSCLGLPAHSKIQEIIELDKEAIVQDQSSQRAGDIFRAALDQLPADVRIWDCCAASGGKSLLLHDINPGARLVVSDIRESILVNLRKRFAKAGITNYDSFVADLGKTTPTFNLQAFDLIICDAPCTGSGTWGRTPEQLYFFDKAKIDYYAGLQRRIVTNTASYLEKNGFLVYITCSVFKKENQEVTAFIENNLDMELIEMKLFEGYDKNADTMFAALFRKRS